MAQDNFTKRWKPQRLVDLNFSSIGDNWHKVGWEVGTDAVEAAANSTTVLVVGGHGVTAKDFVMFSTGGEESEPRHAESITSFTITLGEALSGTPSAGESFTYMTPDTVDACEATTTDTIIKATSHTAAVGDILYFIDGGEVSEPRVVASVAATTITLNAALSGTPTAAEEFAFWTPTSTDAVEAGTTDTIITVASHSASVGDIFVMTSGGEINEVRIVTAADTNTFTLNEALSGTPTAAETFALTTPTGSDLVESDLSDTVLYAEDHSAIAGDVIVMTSGGEDGEAIEVSSVTADSITLISALTGAPSAAETFTILRPVPLNKAVICRLDSSLDAKVLLQESQGIPTFAFTSLRANADASFDLKSNNKHMGSNNSFEGTGGEYYLWVKNDGSAPTSGELDITIIE